MTTTSMSATFYCKGGSKGCEGQFFLTLASKKV